MGKFGEYIKGDGFVKCIQNELSESSLSRVWSQTQKFESGTISAFRSARNCGDGEPYTKGENLKRNAILKSKLLKMGYGVTNVSGVYIENFGSKNERPVNEESFLVVDIKETGKLKQDLIQLGFEFDQDSITYSKPSGEYFLIGTNKCPNAYPGWKKENRLGKPMFGKKGEFHSKVNGRPFVFESMTNRLEDILSETPTHIRSIMEFAKMEVD